ncbi:hypothetical protein JCM11641_001050 [Rhodosporidiobolus odoratus]
MPRRDRTRYANVDPESDDSIDNLAREPSPPPRRKKSRASEKSRSRRAYDMRALGTPEHHELQEGLFGAIIFFIVKAATAGGHETPPGYTNVDGADVPNAALPHAEGPPPDHF